MTVLWVMSSVALSVFIAGIGVRLSIWLRGRVGDDAPSSAVARLSVVARELLAVLSSHRALTLTRLFVRDGLLHVRLWREDKARWAIHACMLWGFLLLLAADVVTVLAVDVLIPGFGVHNVFVDAMADKDTPLLAFVNELGGVLIFLGAGAALVRRYVIRPPQLRSQAQDMLAPVFLATIMLTGYPLEAFRLLDMNVPASRAMWSFVGYPLAMGLAPLQAPWGALYNGLYSLHAAIALTFIAYLPFGKSFHMLVSPLVAATGAEAAVGNRTTAQRNRPASISANYPFTFRQLMELDACTRCGDCVTACPTFAESGDEYVHPLRKIACEKELVRRRDFRNFGKFRKSDPDGVLTDFARGVYRCTMCARCAAVCPVNLQTRNLWLAMREQLHALDRQPETFTRLRDTLTRTRNISGDANANRVLWADNLPARPSGLIGKRSAETVYFIGCVSAFYPAAFGIPQSMTQIMAQANVDFTTLGGEEWCCGFPLILAGMREAAVDLVRHNVSAIRAMGAKRLVTACPSCYHTWQMDYAAMLGEPLGFQVLHSTQWLAEMIERKQLVPGRLEQRVTYHDPCDLGRTSGIYDEPRFVLQSIPGIEFAEMAEHRELALCCGGGGDVEMGEPELTAKVARRRLAQAQTTGAQTIVSACQQCKRTLNAAARKEQADIRVLDIVEIVWNSQRP